MFRIKRRRLFYRIARIVAMFVVGLIVAVIIALSQVNLETLRGDLVDTLRDSTGLPIEVDGKVSWKLSLRPKVEINQVRIPNADWAKSKDGFSASRIDVTLNLISLLRGEPSIQNVKVYDASLSLEKNSHGEYSIQTNQNVPAEFNDSEKPEANKYPFDAPGLKSVEVRGLDANIEGSAYSLTGFQINYSTGKGIREYSGWLKSSDEKLYPFIVTLSEYSEDRKVYPVRIALATGGESLVANTALEGTSLMPIDFKINGSIPDIKSFGKIFGLDLPDMPKIKINLSGGVGHKKLTLRKSSVTWRGTDMDISGTLDWSTSIPYITAKIKSQNIDLPGLFPELYAPGPKWVRPNRDLNVFKGISLRGKELAGHNIDLTVDIGNLVVYRDLVIKNINVHARLKDSKLHTNARARFADGDVRVALDAAADDRGRLTVHAAGIGERIYVGEIMKGIREDNFISELPTNFEFYLTGSGATLSELMSTTTGPIYVYSVAPGYAHSALVSYVYGTDFLTDMRHNIQDLFRSDKKYNQITISCATINLKVRNGVIETTNGIAIETNAINVRLAGGVDLGGETIKASLITVPSRGLKISITGGLTNSMTFTENLAEPDVKINGAAVIGKVASATGIGLLLAPFTGGISIVAGAGIGLVAGDFLENWLADPHPCRTAMESGAPKKDGDPEWLNKPMSQLVGEMIK